ncbi:MAG: DUF1003 domain-containing protein [Xanthobacteraceae bacterium]
MRPQVEEQKHLTRIVERNISALWERRRQETEALSLQDRIADAITRFTGSMTFVYVHLAIFGLWIVANLHWIPGIPAWDESFVVLAMVASVEAIFLSTFILITQNRMAVVADKRADLDLQISLLAEHEITKLAQLVAEMARVLGVGAAVDEDLEEVQQDIKPEAVLDAMEHQDQAMNER